MPMFDLLWTKYREVGGVYIKPPTVRCFFRLLEAFPEELGALREARSRLEDGNDFTLDQMLAMFLGSPNADRLDWVLEDVMIPHPGPGFRPKADVKAALVAVCVAFADTIKRADALLGEPEGTLDEESIAGRDTFHLLMVADRVHVDPLRVLDYPLGFFIDIIDLVIDAAKNSQRKPATSPASDGRTPVAIESVFGTAGFSGLPGIPTIIKEAVPPGAPGSTPIIVDED